MGCFEEADELRAKYEDMLKKGEIQPLYEQKQKENNSESQENQCQKKPSETQVQSFSKPQKPYSKS